MITITTTEIDLPKYLSDEDNYSSKISINTNDIEEITDWSGITDEDIDGKLACDVKFRDGSKHLILSGFYNLREQIRKYCPEVYSYITWIEAPTDNENSIMPDYGTGN